MSSTADNDLMDLAAEFTTEQLLSQEVLSMYTTAFALRARTHFAVQLGGDEVDCQALILAADVLERLADRGAQMFADGSGCARIHAMMVEHRRAQFGVVADPATPTVGADPIGRLHIVPEVP